MITLGWADVLIALVALQRLAELIYSRLNTEALLARGGREAGARHYPLFVLLHGGWLAALFAFSPANPVPHWSWLALFAACQGLRLWTLASLGSYWTTRIITLDGVPPVAVGPYRYLRHPNYLVVIAEVPSLPLGLGLPVVAMVFGALNVALIAWRIRIEDDARKHLASR